MLTKSKFEEAKLRELAEAWKTPAAKPKTTNPTPSGGTQANKNVQCRECVAWGHKYGRGLPKESRQQTRTVNALTTEGSSEMKEKQEKIADLKQQLREAKVDAALVEAIVTMHTMMPVTESDAS